MIEEKDIKENLGLILKELRIQKKLTQEQLAELIGMQPQTITKIETGRVFVSSETLASLCNIFNVEPSLFFNKKLKVNFGSEIDYNTESIRLLSSLTKERQKDIYKIILALQN